MDLDYNFRVTQSLIKTNVILSFLSLICCSLIIVLYCCYKSLRSYVFSLVFFLSISEVINSAANIMSLNILINNKQTNTYKAICSIQSILITYTDFCSLTWIVIISYTISDMMVNYSQESNKRKIAFILIGYLFPLIFTLT